MRKLMIFWLPIVTLILMSTECDDLISVIVESSSYEYEFTAEPTDAGSVDLTVDNAQVNLDSLIEAEGQDPDMIDEITLNDASLTITNGENFDSFDSFELKLAATGISEIVVASLDNLPEGATSVEFVLTDEDLSAFLQEDEFTITVAGALDEAIASEIDMTLIVSYNIKVGI